jgi:hypothetical protein
LSLGKRANRFWVSSMGGRALMKTSELSRSHSDAAC